jgi:hypothetical protein
MKFSSRKKTISRTSALNACPKRLPIIRSEELDGDGLKLTVEYTRPRWQQFLGAPADVTRNYVLDNFGREVYEACNGKRNVSAIVRDFSNRHNVSIAEAESSVSTFLKTLMSRGLVAMLMGKGKI